MDKNLDNIQHTRVYLVTLEESKAGKAIRNNALNTQQYLSYKDWLLREKCTFKKLWTLLNLATLEVIYRNFWINQKQSIFTFMTDILNKQSISDYLQQ